MTSQERAHQLAQQFNAVEDWEDRYRLLLDLGRALPALPDDAKTEANRVHGCQSNVWFVTSIKNDCIYILASSDSSIVQGLIGILHRIYDGNSAADITAFDVQALFVELGFDRHLSAGRRNGLAGMIKRIKEAAEQHISTANAEQLR